MNIYGGKFNFVHLKCTGNRQSSKKHEWMTKLLQPEEKRNKQTIFQLISQRTNQKILVVNIGHNKPKDNIRSSRQLRK